MSYIDDIKNEIFEIGNDNAHRNSKGLEALEKMSDKVERLQDTFLPEDYEDYGIIEKELKDYQEINIKYKLAIEFIDNIANEFCEHDLDELADKIVKVKKALEILKAFDFKFEDYTEELNGSVCVSQRRIILDNDEIDLLEEALI